MYHLPYGGLCLVRVYALYGRSRRILGLLLGVGAVSLVNACVSHFSRASNLVCLCLTPFSPQKLSMFTSRHTGTIPVMSSFPGCSQFTPLEGYAADPACDSFNPV